MCVFYSNSINIIVKQLGLGLGLGLGTWDLGPGTWDLGNGNRVYPQSQEMTV